MESIPQLLQVSSVIGSAIQDTETVSLKSLVSYSFLVASCLSSLKSDFLLSRKYMK